MQNLSTFLFKETSVRVFNLSSENWFCADDVAKALKLKNTTMALKALDLDERSKLNLGRQGEVNIINESGLYCLIMRSREAVKQGTVQHEFRKWVTSEVLPSIRKTGTYTVPVEQNRLTDEQVGYLYQSVMRICAETAQPYQTVFGGLKRHFGVASYKHIKQEDFQEACKWIGVNIPLQENSPNKAYYLEIFDFPSDYVRKLLPSSKTGHIHFKDLQMMLEKDDAPIRKLLWSLHQQGYPVDGLYNEYNSLYAMVRNMKRSYNMIVANLDGCDSVEVYKI